MSRSWVITVWILVLVVAAGVVAGIARSEYARGRPFTPTPYSGAGSAPQAPADLRLSEILASPARDWDGDGAFVARQDEWVELRNEGSVAISLGSYYLSDNDSTIRIVPVGVLQPGAVVVVTGRMAEDWQRFAGRTVTGLSLNNSGDTVRLFHMGPTDTVEVDTKAYNGIEGGTDRSTGTIGEGSSSSWVLFDGLNRYTGSGQPPGTGCQPTPGLTNDCTLDVQSTTWGKIKMRFR
jgi:Lamin Tail Domain